MGKFIDLAPRRINRNFDHAVSNSQKSNRNSNTIYNLIIIALVIVFIYFLSSLLSQPPSASNSDNSAASTPTPSVSPSISASENSYSSNNTKTPTPEFSAQNTYSAPIENFSIIVLNGSGTPNAANETKDNLEKQGFQVIDIGTANNLYSQTVIYYKTGYEDSAKKVASALKDYQVLTEENSELASDSDVLVVIGQK